MTIFAMRAFKAVELLDRLSKYNETANETANRGESAPPQSASNAKTASAPAAMSIDEVKPEDKIVMIIV
jgi:hypothetical protein